MSKGRVFGACLLAAAVTSAAILSSQAALAVTGPGCIIVGSDGNPHVITPFTVNTGQVPGSPANSCQECNLSGPGGLTAWSPIPGSNGSACNTPCSGGTGALAIPAGQCSASPNGNGTVCNNGFCDYGCWIGSTPSGCATAPAPGNTCTGSYNYYSADVTPANTINETGSGGCMTCQPSTTPFDWTPLPNGTVCGASEQCTNGLCLSTCINISPNSVNFGTVAQSTSGPAPHPYCASQPVTITVTNSCTTTYTVNTPTVASTPSGQYTLAGTGDFPATLSDGQSATFTVTYGPNGAGIPPPNPAVDPGAISVNAPALGVYTVPLQGQASGTSPTNTDTFTVPNAQVDVDMLWVVDTDDGTVTGMNSITNPSFVTQFVNQAVADNLNVNMAMTSTGNVCGNVTGNPGQFIPYGGQYFWNTQTNGAAATIAGITGVWNSLGVPWAWGCGPQDECMMDTTYVALCHAAGIDGCSNNYNQGFLRPNAFLAVLVLEDDCEDDHGFYYLGTVNAYQAFLNSVKNGNHNLVSWSYASDGEASGSGPVGQLVTQTGGVGPTPGHDSSNDTDPTDVARLGAGAISNILSIWSGIQAEAQEIFNLTESPGSTSCGGLTCGGASPCPASITVMVGPPGNQVQMASNGSDPWCYNAGNDTINFSNPQTPGNVIGVTYTAVCNP